MSGREKGVATQPCPECGADLPAVTLPDGGVTTETCSNCNPAETTEKASATETAPTREKATPVVSTDPLEPTKENNDG